MKCADARELLSALLDDAPGPAESADVRAHLEACEACRAHLAELESVVGLVREIPAPPLPDGFATEVVARLPRRGVPAPIRWLAPLAAAACLLLVVKFGFFSGEESAVRHLAETKDVAVDALQGKDEGDAGSVSGTAFDEESSGYAGRKPAPAKMPQPDATTASREAPLGAPAPDPEAAAPEPVSEPAPGALSPPPVERPAGDTGRRSQAGDRRYAVQGAEPDTAAGVILAELRRKRTREAPGDEPAGEKVVQARTGEVSGMLLYLTPGELEFVTCLLTERPGVRIARLNGRLGKARDAKKEEADAEDHDDAGGKRVRVELRFR
jgi:hypothetical protein